MFSVNANDDKTAQWLQAVSGPDQVDAGHTNMQHPQLKNTYS